MVRIWIAICVTVIAVMMGVLVRNSNESEATDTTDNSYAQAEYDCALAFQVREPGKPWMSVPDCMKSKGY